MPRFNDDQKSAIGNFLMEFKKFWNAPSALDAPHLQKAMQMWEEVENSFFPSETPLVEEPEVEPEPVVEPESEKIAPSKSKV